MHSNRFFTRGKSVFTRRRAAILARSSVSFWGAIAAVALLILLGLPTTARADVSAGFSPGAGDTMITLTLTGGSFRPGTFSADDFIFTGTNQSAFSGAVFTRASDTVMTITGLSLSAATDDVITVPTATATGSVTAAAGVDISASFTDSVFKQFVWTWLGYSGSPGGFTKQNLIDRAPAKSYTLDVSKTDVTSLAGIDNFEGTGLTTLDCSWAKKLTTIPVLPSSLQTLKCFWDKHVTQLPALPPGLTTLFADYAGLISLPTIPPGLTNISWNNNYINYFPVSAPYQFRFVYNGTTPIKFGLGQTCSLPISALQRIETNDGINWQAVSNPLPGNPDCVEYWTNSASDFAFSSSSGEAAIDEYGNITGASVGTCTIYADYNGVNSDYTRVAIPVTVEPNIMISGNAGVAGATLSWTDGTVKTATADGSGGYCFTVSYNWNGTVTPSLAGYTFSPTSKTYATVATDQTSQDYQAAKALFGVIAAGGAHSLILNNGAVSVFGDAISGQSTALSGVADAVSVWAGGNYAFAVNSSGNLVIWGQ